MGTSDAPTYDDISPYYDLMMQDRTPYIHYYSALLKAGQQSLLDIACGTGMITVEFARRLRALAEGEPVRVTGLEISAGMLSVARSRASDIDWIEGDMRHLPKHCGPVDLAFCCYNSLQHLDAQGLGQAFRSIRSALRNDGRFAFDMYRPNLSYLRLQRTDTLARAFQDANGETMEIREDSIFDEEAGTLYLNWRLVRQEKPRARLVARTSFHMWQHHPETVEAALAAAGFGILERYGDLDRSPWHSGAKKQVIVCRAL